MSAAYGSTGGARVRALARLHAWKAFLALGAGMTVGYFLLPSTEEQDIFYQLPEMLAVAAILVAVWLHRPRDARTWVLLAVGLGLSTAGDWTWVVLDRVYGLDPFPSVADAFYLVGLGAIGLSMWMLVRGRLPDGDTAGLLDSLIVTVGAGLLTWVFLMAPVVSDTSQSTFELAVALAYPLIDILLLSALVRLVLVPGELSPSLRLTIAALVAWLVADYPYAMLALEDGYEVGMLLDAGWIGGTILWGAAALHPSMGTITAPAARAEARLSPWRLLLLATASLMAPALLLAGWAGGVEVDVPVVAAACIVLFALVIARLQGVVADLRQTLRERTALEAELEHRALHDPLTGLANRALFHDRLAHSLARRDGSVAVMFLDLDDFKTINDSLGHEAGDQALRWVANAFSKVVRAEDTVARLGGDEFAVLLSGTPDRLLATRLAGRLLEAVEQPLELAGATRTLGVSIGIALGEAGGAVEADDLMRDADIAMYVAKQQGKRTFTVFEQAEHHGLVRGLALRNDLELAMERREFTVAYQPIMALDSGRVAGVEALVRWQHPTLGELQPEEFIPLAEATGAIVPLGRWILAESCRAAAASTWGDAFVSVNLSVQQLEEPAFVDALRATLGESGLPPERLVLEVTESARMHGSHGPDALAAVRALGVRLAIDDFGTGYAALSQLSAHRFDLVKLDASFVTPLGREAGADAAALVGGIAQLARTIGVELVAEGIEDGVQLARLRQAGCPLGQGFHFAPALSEPELRRFLASVADQPRSAAARPAPRLSEG
jgi:diguanylate cyclase (GGDEF)-like protein